MWAVTSEMPTTAGIPKARAKIALCAVAPPSSVQMASTSAGVRAMVDGKSQERRQRFVEVVRERSRVLISLVTRHQSFLRDGFQHGDLLDLDGDRDEFAI